MEDDHCIWLNIADLLDELVLTVGDPHVSAVEALGLEQVGESGENNSHVALSSQLHSLVQKCLISNVLSGVIALCVADLGVFCRSGERISYLK